MRLFLAMLCAQLAMKTSSASSSAQKTSEMRILLGTMTFGGQTAASDALAQLELFYAMVFKSLT